jgi:hypothetical protein
MHKMEETYNISMNFIRDLLNDLVIDENIIMYFRFLIWM